MALSLGTNHADIFGIYQDIENGDFTHFPGEGQPSSSVNISLHSGAQNGGRENTRPIQAAGKLCPPSQASEWAANDTLEL